MVQGGSLSWPHSVQVTVWGLGPCSVPLAGVAGRAGAAAVKRLHQGAIGRHAAEHVFVLANMNSERVS